MRCPTCKRATDSSNRNPYRPFCSKRCQMIDLGAWAGQEYKVAGPATDDHEHQDDEPRNKRGSD